MCYCVHTIPLYNNFECRLTRTLGTQKKMLFKHPSNCGIRYTKSHFLLRKSEDLQTLVSESESNNQSNTFAHLILPLDCLPSNHVLHQNINVNG